MEMWHKSSRCGTIFYKLIGQQVGFKAANTIALNAFHLVQRLHKVYEALACRHSKMSDVHTRKHNLLTALCSSLLSLFHKRGNTWISRKTTSIRDSAICAEIVATILHLQEIASAITSRATWLESINLLRWHRMILMFHTPRIREILYEVSLLVGSQHQAHSLYLAHRLGRELRIASRHHNKGSRILTHQAMNSLTAFVVGNIRNRACIYEANISLLALLCLHHSHLFQEFSKSRSLRKIEFTTERIVSRLLALKNRTVYHI